MAKYEFQVPTVVVPSVRIPQPDGSILIRAGKPIITEPDVSVSEAAKMLGMSPRYIEYQCSIGLFPGARKPGGRPRSRWRIPRTEIVARLTQAAGEE